MKYALLIFGLIMLCSKNSIAQQTAPASASPSYIIIKHSLWWGWKMKHVDKPQKKLRKWHYDTKTNTYFRMKSGYGINVLLRG
ncbi:hypothetical protein CJD36_007945 [Flavipsychrobacter stenotrophus]|uniref:Uncharacterized protein n=1 Tax=Flavipsychrobacter stenotrophus TaxID=2077091 RepID=A0A2S7SYM9_9BACT|nr:hypothetical protein CJD36_007945 [Flavipsychrobacter stenotrophus]